VSTSPSTRSRGGTGSIPQLGVFESCNYYAPFAGMIQIRFCGFDLSRYVARRHPGRLTLAAFAAVALAGCGGGALSKREYERQLQKDVSDVEIAIGPLTHPPASMDKFADQIANGQQTLRRTAADLEEVTPPKSVAADNDLLVHGLRQFADDLRPLRRSVLERDADALRVAIGDLQSSTALKDVQRAVAGIKEKGFDVGE
jgi:hypothetical protein